MKLYDAHCHVSVACLGIDEAELGQELAAGNPGELGGFLEMALMSTNQFDWTIVRDAGHKYGGVIGGFGIHPWYSHMFVVGGIVTDKRQHYSDVFGEPVEDVVLANLPEPISLDKHFEALQQCLEKLPRAIVGEIGLDKVFRIPKSGYLGNLLCSEMGLSPYKVTMAHQIKVFEKQILVALELGLPVSIHCVKCHGTLYQAVKSMLLKLSTSPGFRLCLHSYTGSVDQAMLWLKLLPEVYFSFSRVINGADIPKKKSQFAELISKLPDRCILIETDKALDIYYQDRTSSGHRKDLLAIQNIIAEIKQWPELKASDTLYENWANYLKVV